MGKTCFKLLLIFVFVSFQIAAKSQNNVKIKRLISEIEFDGKPFESAWQEQDQFPLTMHRPNFGTEPAERSEVFITYDDEFLWVGARLYMNNPSKILSTSKKRDESADNSDSFGIILDSYNDNENGLAFFTMPTGLRIDYTISNDATSSGGGGGGGGGGGSSGGGGGYMNLSWNTFWDVITTQDDKGWYVEMKIPFSSIKFKPQNDVATMGLLINRTICYNNEIDTYPSIDPKFGTSATLKPSLGVDIEFEGVKPAKPIYVSPYVIGGFARDWINNEENTAYVKEDDPSGNIGLDVKYSINSNLTLDATVNTDFAQVEADNQQVNLTRYSLYFPEKRAFFQERSSLFNFSLGENSNLFYSRRIGLVDGSPIKIYGGVRLIGRIGKWDMGLIDMQTESHEETPGENFGVFRMRRQVINPNSYVGGILTSRIGTNGNQNYSYGLDGIFRLFGNDYLDLKIAQTVDSETDFNLASLNPTFLSAGLERRSKQGFTYEMLYTYAGREFSPESGYLKMQSMQGFTSKFSHGWIPGPESKFFKYHGSIKIDRYERLEDGKLESMSVEPAWSMTTKKGSRAELGVEFLHEGVSESFEIADSVFVLGGDYKNKNISLKMYTPESKPISLTFNGTGGEFYDGYRYTGTFSPIFNVSSSLQLTGSYQHVLVNFPDRDMKLHINNVSAKILYMLNTKLSATLFMQYSSAKDYLLTNFRLRYNPKEGNDFYLVFNEYRPATNIIYLPELPDYFDRTIMLKYTYTFRL